MPRRHRSLVLSLLLLAPAPSPAAERLTDEQVRKLIEDIDRGYDAWKNDLERRNLDDAKITSAERTVDVKSFLKDFEESIDTLKGRFKPEYAASPEAIALLRRGSDVELRNRRQGQPPSSEWTALSSKLGALAGAYAVPWPVESMNVQAARLNDGEVALRLERMEGSLKQVKGETEKAARANKAIDKASRESMKKSIEELEQRTKEVRQRVKDDRPAAVEVDQLLSRTGSLKQTLTKLSLAPAGWPGVESGADLLAREYDLRKP